MNTIEELGHVYASVVQGENTDKLFMKMAFDAMPQLLAAVGALEDCHTRLKVLLDSGSGNMLDNLAEERAAKILGKLK